MDRRKASMDRAGQVRGKVARKKVLGQTGSRGCWEENGLRGRDQEGLPARDWTNLATMEMTS